MIPLFKPYMPKELPELYDILYSGKLSYGKWGKLFEQKIGNFLGNERVVTLNSFNSAFLVTLATLGIRNGDEIIASPMGCLASIQPFITQGIKIVWGDIDPETGTLDPDDVKQKISKKTKAVFHNHFCGYPGYINEINSLCKKNGIYIVDDAIEAFGSEYNGRKIGNTGSDATVFSFQTIRLPNTMDGGAISFSDETLIEKAKLIRDYGIDRSKFRDKMGEIDPECDIKLAGYGALPNELSSYLGYCQMDNIVELLGNQLKNAKNWENNLNEILNIQGIYSIKTISNAKPNYWVYGIFSNNKNKDIKRIRGKGYYASGIHLNTNRYSVFLGKNSITGAEEFNSKFIAIPCGWWII